MKEKIPFVNSRLRNRKAFWSPEQRKDGGMPRGGLAIFVGERFADKVLDAGVDKKNAFMWVTVATEVGQLGVANVYGAHLPSKRAKIWHRMLATLDTSFPWVFGGDWNFVERRQDKQGGTRFCHKEEDIWIEARDMEWAVGDPWVLKPQCVVKPSPGYTQWLDRFYFPVQWMPRVRQAAVIVGAFKSDHMPVIMDVALRAEDIREHKSSALRFFRVNMDVACLEVGRAGVQDILKKWASKEEDVSALSRLEKALTECRSFLRELGKEMAKQRRARETALRGTLESLLLRIPSADEEQLKVLQAQINEAARQLTNLEEGKAKGHRVRAGLKWELEGVRPSAFFFQKLQEKRAKQTMESLLDKTGRLHTSQKEMEKVVEDVYTEVFSSAGPDVEWQELWEEYGHLLKAKVTPQQRAMLERPITVEELEGALKEMPSGKSPGHDGVTKEFFLLF